MSKTRFQDTPRELRIRLKCSCKLSSLGDIRFFHEKTDKDDQVLSATLSSDLETLDVVLLTDRLDTIKKSSKT